MGRLKTYDEFQNEMKSINPDIIVSPPYYGLKKQKIKCECKKCGYKWETYPCVLLNGSGCKECNKRAFGKFKYDIDQVITTQNRNLQIIDREYRPTEIKRDGKPSYTQNRKYYQYKCLNCNNNGWIIESRLDSGDGCNVCHRGSPNKLVPGVNDIFTVLPKIALLFKDINEAKTHTRGSKSTAIFVCPDCGREFEKRIDAVCASGLACPCKDKRSYPNKFLYSLLEQLDVCFVTEKKFDWSDNRSYDGYIEYNGSIILVEMNGNQHYGVPIRKNGGFRSVEEEKQNDEYKRSLAYDNGIDYYFSIDCRESNVDYIRKSINSSGLLERLGFTDEDVDWNKCDEFATSNFTKAICDYYMEHTSCTAYDISEHFAIGVRTVQKYLRKGREFGWCDYDGKRSNWRYQSPLSKPVYCETINMEFRNAKAAAEYLNLPDAKCNGRSIRNAIKFNREYYGYLFRYV